MHGAKPFFPKSFTTWAPSSKLTQPLLNPSRQENIPRSATTVIDLTSNFFGGRSFGASFHEPLELHGVRGMDGEGLGGAPFERSDTDYFAAPQLDLTAAQTESDWEHDNAYLLSKLPEPDFDNPAGKYAHVHYRLDVDKNFLLRIKPDLKKYPTNQGYPPEINPEDYEATSLQRLGISTRVLVSRSYVRFVQYLARHGASVSIASTGGWENEGGATLGSYLNKKGVTLTDFFNRKTYAEKYKEKYCVKEPRGCCQKLYNGLVEFRANRIGLNLKNATHGPLDSEGRINVIGDDQFQQMMGTDYSVNARLLKMGTHLSDDVRNIHFF